MRFADPHFRIQRAVFPGLLVVAVAIAFSNSLRVPFLLDDFPTIPGNASITRLSAITSVLFPPPEVYSAGRPVLNLSFALNHAIGGTAAGGYHVVNVVIHMVAALLLFGIARRGLELPAFARRFTNTAFAIAFLIAALWALHPLQTVSVTYVSQRAESLMGLFYLLTLYCFLRSLHGGIAWKIASILACALGMATKEVMVTAPLLVFLFDATCVTRSFRQAWRQRWPYYGGLAATWLLLAALMLTSELGRRGVGEHLNWFDYARIECVAVARYLQRALWPTPLVFDYGANLPLPSWRQMIAPLIVLAAIGGVAVRQLAHCRVSGFLAFSFLLLLAPTSSVVPVAGQPMAENRMYLPLAAVLTSLVVGAALTSSRPAAPALAAAIVALGALTHARNDDYRSAVSIWRDTVTKQPINDRAWVYLSEALKAERKPDEAINALLAGLRHRPNSAELANNVGVALFAAGRYPESFSHFQNAIRLKPGYADAYYNYGAALYGTSNFVPALDNFRIHLQLNPRSVEAHNYMGLCFLQVGKPAAAIPHFQQALEINPTHPHARSNLEYARTQAAAR